jgi:hypothetical protein
MGWKSKLWIIPVAASLIVGVAVLYLIAPEKATWMPPCLFHKLTGLQCPGCGTARGLHKLLHGDVLGAWRMNPLMVVAIPLLAYLIIGGHLRARRGADAEPRPLPTWVPWLIVAVVAAFWVARNIPVYPFTLLAPH